MMTAPRGAEPEPSAQGSAAEPCRAPRALAYNTPNPMMSPLYAIPGTADAVAETLEDGETKALCAAFLTLYRGQIREAERATERLLGRELRFVSRVGCAVLLSVCAIHLGSRRDWARSRSLFASLERQQPDHLGLVISKCTLNTSLYIGEAPEWLRKGRFAGMSRHGHASACYFYAKFLLVQKNYAGVLIIAEPAIASAQVDGELLIELYLHLIAAAAYRQTGEGESAAEHAQAAVDLALPDGLYTPLTEFRMQVGKALDEALKRRNPMALARVRSLYRPLAVGFTRLRNAVAGGSLNPEMTLQEYEIACMAQQGMRNVEIAARLNVTESSVKKYFYSLYQKLRISRRSELEKYVF